MEKRIAIVACLILAAAFVGWQLNTSKTTYINGLDAYSSLPMRQYMFERDCYIFGWKGRATDWPQVGDHAVVPELPAEVKAENLGDKFPGVRLLDVAHVGDRFRIASVRRDQDRHKTTITFEIVFLDEASRPYSRLDAYWIMDHAPEAHGAAPTLLPDYAVPVVGQKP